jgi:uncharacterized repeat protein (TIGR01451 family)
LFIVLFGGLPLPAQIPSNALSITCPTEAQPGAVVSCALKLTLTSPIDSLVVTVLAGNNWNTPPLTTGQLGFAANISGAVTTGASPSAIGITWNSVTISTGSNQLLGSLSLTVPATAVQGQIYGFQVNSATASLGGVPVPLNYYAASSFWVGHPGILCSTYVSVTPTLRSAGYAENIGDITFICTGGDALPLGNVIPSITIQVTLNTAITSRLLPASGEANLSEALLLVDEPGSGLPWEGGNGPFGPLAPQTVCPTPVTGCTEYVSSKGGFLVATNTPQGSNATTAGYNVFQGTVSGNSVTFTGIPLLAPVQAGSTRVFRITNVRADASSIATSSPTPLIASISVNTSMLLATTYPTPTVGFIQDGLTTSTDGVAAFSQCSSQVRVPVTTIRFTENFGTSFKARLAAQSNTLYAGQSGSPLLQNIPGTIYNSESNLVIAGTAGGQTTGVADFGTRLKAAFNNVPAGIRLFVSATNVSNAALPITPPQIPGGSNGNSGPFAMLVGGESATFNPLTATDFAPGASGNVPVVEISVVNGSAVAVWELVNTNPNMLESVQFGVYASYSANSGANSPALGTATVSLSYAPTAANGGVASEALPIPRFTADPNPARNLMSISSCVANLGITKTHSGNFNQGQSGATYAVTVSNAANASPSTGTVTVTETVPAGLTLVAMSGTGWTCPGTAANNCTRNDSVAPGSSYPAITVTVNVAANAASLQVNSVSVSGGGAPTASTTDSTNIYTQAVLSVTKSHIGYFTKGQNGATYAVTVSNAVGSAPTSGVVTVAESLPAGLTLVSMAGSGWTCPTGSYTCTRSDALASGSSYPALTVMVNVAGNAASPQVNSVILSGGGSLTTTASDSTLILPAGVIPRADFNSDGHSDVIWQDPQTGFAQVWFLGGAQGTSVTGAANLTQSNTWRIVGVGDFNQDGYQDVVWQDSVSGAAQVWFLGGAQGNAVTGAAVLSGGNAWRIMSVADFNADGHPDCIWQDPVTGQAQIWLMGGANGVTVTGAANLTASNTWRIAGTGDFDHDGHPDAVWQDPVSGATQIWYLGGVQGNVVIGAVTLSPSNSWRIASVADFNGDGSPDVVWQNPTSGESQFWFLGGAQGTTLLGGLGLSGANSWRIAGPR